MYNSSLRGGNKLRCLAQGLRGVDEKASATCAPCGELECITCGADGLAIRPEYAVAQLAQSWLVFKCPFEGACIQDAAAGQRCKEGHTGLLCAECQSGYGLDRDDCVKCSVTNSNPYAAGGLLAVVFILVGIVYLWRRRDKQRSGSSRELSQGLYANPLQGSPEGQGPRGSTSSGLGKAAAVAQKSTDVYMLLRVVYQPVRIIVGYIQVVTQIGREKPAIPISCSFHKSVRFFDL